MIESSAGLGRDWKPSKTDDEYNAEIIRDSVDDFLVVARETGQDVQEMRAALAVRATKEGSPWQ